MIEAKVKAPHISRRRFIAITAALGAASALPRGAAARELQTYTWKGIALGAEASLTLQHPEEAIAKEAIEACLAEVARLEAIFSLFRADSSLVRLNAAGHLADAPLDLRILLAEALSLAERSGGAFDPTIQPLWALYAGHFASRAAPDGPPKRDIDLALRLVDWRSVAIEKGSVRLLKPGMALTFNGIAQGYITDKVGDLLKTRGFEHVLVNMGEQLTLGPKWDGTAWRVGIADPALPERVIESVALVDGAMATSGGYGCRFDAAGRFTHILDPRTGAVADGLTSVTVLADRATAADGLSTALSVAPNSPSLLAGATGVFSIRQGAATGQWWSKARVEPASRGV
jgi:thiamine biosynthesis lipoprotein